ncbi:unnamed protein product, partial [Vitis vinifera]
MIATNPKPTPPVFHFNRPETHSLSLPNFIANLKREDSENMEELKPRPANSSPLTTLSFLDRAATVYGDCPSVVYNSTTYTWSQTHHRCLQVASSIKSLGIGRGQVVSVVAPNIPAMYELHFAVPMAGAVLNTINTRLDAKTVSVLLRHSESKLIFVDYQSRPLILESLSLFPPSSQRPLLWNPMILNYTSGTTSSPKGVVHCHRGIFIVTVDSLIDWCVPKQPVYLWTLPMFHANGWSFPWGMAAVGGTNVCLRKFDASVIYEAIRVHRVTHMCGAPVQKWNRLPATERARLKSRQGVRTVGMTEVDVLDPGSGLSVKRDGSSLGEIVLRGGCIMLGYLKDPKGTSKSLTDDGWFFTGDVGVMHSDGYLEIKDRSKDVIISGGENLSSVEVESVLYTHPAVNEAAVVARPDDFWGETPCAFVSLKPERTEQPTEKEIMEYCRARMPHYMVPKTVVFEEELPKTSTGKIQKFVLRETAKAMGSSRVRKVVQMKYLLFNKISFFNEINQNL